MDFSIINHIFKGVEINLKRSSNISIANYVRYQFLIQLVVIVEIISFFNETLFQHKNKKRSIDDRVVLI